MKKTAFLLFIGIYQHYAFGQSDKNISKHNIPYEVSSYIDKKYPGHSSVSYYRETGTDSSYYEATFKYQKDIFSLSFDSAGVCMETEIEIPFESLSLSIKQSIEQKLKQDFQTYKIKKTEEVRSQDLFLYELEVKGKQHDTEYYEYYFDQNGRFVRVELIQLKIISSFF